MGQSGKRLLYEAIADDLMEKIQRGVYTVGNYIPTERELSETYGASRGVIREAVRVLEQQGLVENVHGGKRRLLRTCPEETERDEIYSRLEKAKIEEYLDARIYLDDVIVALACQRATEEDLQRIEQVYSRLQSFYQNDSVEGDSDVCEQFHLAIAQAAHNSVLENVYRMALSLNTPLRRETLKTKSDRARMLEEHSAIFHAILERDILLSRLSVRIHNKNVMLRYKKQDKESKKGGFDPKRKEQGEQS